MDSAVWMLCMQYHELKISQLYIGYHMRGEAISVLSLEGRYHIFIINIYDIFLKAIKLISPRPDYDNLFITYFNTCALTTRQRQTERDLKQHT